MPLLEEHPSKQRDSVDEVAEDFLAINVWLILEHDQWYALVEQFDVAGVGLTPRAAIENAEELLNDYLALAASEGRSLKEAQRPISLSRKIRLRAIATLTKARGNRQSHPAEKLRLPFEPQHC